MSWLRLVFDGTPIGKIEVERQVDQNVLLIFIQSRIFDLPTIAYFHINDDQIIDLARPYVVPDSDVDFGHIMHPGGQEIIAEINIHIRRDSTSHLRVASHSLILDEQIHRGRRIAITGDIEDRASYFLSRLELELEFHGYRSGHFQFEAHWSTSWDSLREPLALLAYQIRADGWLRAVVATRHLENRLLLSNQLRVAFRLSERPARELAEPRLHLRASEPTQSDTEPSCPSEAPSLRILPPGMATRDRVGRPWMKFLAAPFRGLGAVAEIAASSAVKVAHGTATAIQKAYRLPADPRIDDQSSAPPRGLEGLPPPPPRVTAYRPAWLVPKRQTTIYVYIALPAAQAAVRTEAIRSLGQPGNRAKEAPPIPLRRILIRGESISVRMTLDGFQITQPDAQPWEEPWIRFLFPIVAPADVTIGTHRPLLSVYKHAQGDQESLASLDFALEVRSASPRRELLRAGLFATGLSSALAVCAATNQHLLPPELGWPTSAVCAVGGVGAGIVLRPTVLATEARDQTQVFISYAREDLDRVRSYVDVLNLAGVYPWIDVDQLTGGDRWERNLNDALNRADLFFIFWSRHAAVSEWVARELKQAIQRQATLGNRRFIVPIMLADDRPDQEHPLSKFQFIFSRDSSQPS